MGNSLRCCIACILPCGALDVVRVLHVDGQVDVLSGRVTARDVMKAHPRHLLSQPMYDAIVKKKPSFLHPDTELQKGKIYVLVPCYNLPARDTKPAKSKTPDEITVDDKREAKKCKLLESQLSPPEQQGGRPNGAPRRTGSRRPSSRRGGGVWKPILRSIPERDDTYGL